MKVGSSLALVTNPIEAAKRVAHEAGAALGGATPELAVLFASSHFLLEAGALVARVSDEIGSPPLIGCLAESVIGGGREVESEPAVSLWLAAGIGPVEAFSVDFLRTPSGGAYFGYRFNAGVHVMLSDPAFPVDALLGHLNEHSPGALVIGGVASGAFGLPSGGLFLDDRVVSGGAVGVRLADGQGVELLVSQGCRPVGDPHTVTRAEGNVIHELGGRPPLSRLQQLARSLDDRDRHLLAGGVQVGLVIDEYKVERAPGDFLIRGVLGVDSETGAIAVGEEVEAGQTVQFHVRDADSADEDLRRTLEGGLAGRAVSGGLLFTCNGRGSRLFGKADHDVGLLREVAGDIPVSGFFCAGELGPAGGKNFLHGFTASIAAFVEPRLEGLISPERPHN